MFHFKNIKLLFVLFLLNFLICISLFSQDSQNDSINLEFINKIQIPEDIGIIKEIYIPEKGKINEFIVYIQDAHCNFEAQMNIGKIVKLLVEDYGFKLINVEGTAGLIDTKPFSTFKDRKVKLDFADYFMKQGKITGPEYISITTDLEFTIFGIEDEALYAENYTAYMNTLEYKDRVNAYTSKLLERLNDLKEHMYHEDFLLFDKESRKYENKTLEFADYTKYLEKFALEKNIDLSSFQNFVMQGKARKLEEEIDFKEIENQRSALISEFNNILKGNNESIKKIVQQSLAFRMREITSDDYYAFLIETAKENNVEMTPYSLVLKYRDYLKYYYAIDKSKIIDEVSEVEVFIKNKLYANDEERELDSLSRIIGILNRLFKLEVIKSDYLFFKEHRDGFNFRKTKEFIVKYGPKYNISLGFDVDFALIEKNIHWVIKFYEAALNRDRVLIENALARMINEKVNKSALITGGFHSEGLMGILREKGKCFMLVAPRIIDPTAETTYEEVMRAQSESVKGYKGILTE